MNLAPSRAAVASEKALASHLAMTTGTEVEVASETSETERVLALPEEGQFRSEISAAPVRVRRGEAWEGVDTTWVEGGDGVISPAATVTPVRLGHAGSRDVVSLIVQGKEFTYTWESPLPVPQLAGDLATFRDVLPGVDLSVRAGTTSVQTFFVVRSPEAARDPRVQKLTLGWRGEGLTPRQAEAEHLLVDEQGSPLISAGQAMAWDSTQLARVDGRTLMAGNRAAGEQETASGISSAEAIEQPPAGGGTSVPVTWTADRMVLDATHILAAQGTVFPVVIDPVVRDYAWNGSRQLNSNNSLLWATPEAEATVGFQGHVWPYYKSRHTWHFDTSSFRGASVSAAKFTAFMMHSTLNTCGLTAFGPKVELWRTAHIDTKTVWPGPALSERVDASPYGSGNSGAPNYCKGVEVSWNMNSAANNRFMDRMAATTSDLTLMIKVENDETVDDKNGWRIYRKTSSAGRAVPVLTVTWSKPPAAPPAPSMGAARIGGAGTWASPFLTNTARPSFTVPVNSPTGDPASAEFFLYTPTSVLITSGTATPAGVSSGQIVTFTPAVDVCPATTYVVKARVITRAADGERLVGPIGAGTVIRCDRTPPVTPTVTFTDPSTAGAAKLRLMTDGPHLVKSGYPVRLTADSSDDVTAFRVTVTPGAESTTTVAAGATLTKNLVFNTAGLVTVTVLAFDGINWSAKPSTTLFWVEDPKEEHRWNFSAANPAADEPGAAPADDQYHPRTLPLLAITKDHVAVDGLNGEALDLTKLNGVRATQGLAVSPARAFSLLGWVTPGWCSPTWGYLVRQYDQVSQTLVALGCKEVTTAAGQRAVIATGWMREVDGSFVVISTPPYPLADLDAWLQVSVRYDPARPGDNVRVSLRSSTSASALSAAGRLTTRRAPSDGWMMIGDTAATCRPGLRCLIDSVSVYGSYMSDENLNGTYGLVPSAPTSVVAR